MCCFAGSGGLTKETFQGLSQARRVGFQIWNDHANGSGPNLLTQMYKRLAQVEHFLLLVGQDDGSDVGFRSSGQRELGHPGLLMKRLKEIFFKRGGCFEGSQHH
jgi:hypothetical protein